MITNFLSSVTAAVIVAVGLFGLERWRTVDAAQSRRAWSTLIIILVVAAILVIFGLMIVGHQSSLFARLSHRFS